MDRVTLKAVRTTASLIYLFAERESKTRYKRSILGWFWSLANPLATVLVYSFVFGLVYGAKAPSTDNGVAENFGLYLFTGLIVWSIFSTVVRSSMEWLIDVGELRRKIYFPTDTALFGGALSASVQVGLEALVLVAIMLILGNLSWTLVFLPVAVLLALFFGLGIGFIAAVLNTRYRDVQYLMGLLLTMGFFAVPVVYTPDLLEAEAVPALVRIAVQWNPPALFVEIARDAMYFLQVPAGHKLAVSLAWTIVLFSVGWAYFRAKSMEISEEA